ncbi:hypothetical protein SDC9_153403 [bioreactor metagenome]|uniref:Uncharacterized protein n=1 Tax=bioreactor metagenome TaxID=1076179 RepID=A0A645EW95_9ZZZZ
MLVKKIQTASQSQEALAGDVDFFVGQDGAGVVDHHIRLNGDRLARIVVATAQVVAEPSVRDAVSLNAGAGKQRRFAEQHNVFEGFIVCVCAHGESSPFLTL